MKISNEIKFVIVALLVINIYASIAVLWANRWKDEIELRGEKGSQGIGLAVLWPLAVGPTEIWILTTEKKPKDKEEDDE